MTKEQLWKIFSTKNPSFNGDGNVTLSARGLRKMFNTTWDISMYQGEEEVEKTEQDFQQNNYKCSSASVEALRTLFGMK